MLNVAICYCYAEYPCAECGYFQYPYEFRPDECHYAECHYVECRYAECRDAV